VWGSDTPATRPLSYRSEYTKLHRNAILLHIIECETEKPNVLKPNTIVHRYVWLTNRLRRVQSFSRREQLPSCSDSQKFIEPGGSLPCSQALATGPVLGQIHPAHRLQFYFRPSACFRIFSLEVFLQFESPHVALRALQKGSVTRWVCRLAAPQTGRCNRRASTLDVLLPNDVWVTTALLWVNLSFPSPLISGQSSFFKIYLNIIFPSTPMAGMFIFRSKLWYVLTGAPSSFKTLPPY
jgi:hypothetical protein